MDTIKVSADREGLSSIGRRRDTTQSPCFSDLSLSPLRVMPRCECAHPGGTCSGRFTEWDEWRKNGVDLCEQTHIFLAKRGLKLVRLS
jgi:hypothetical protein